MNPKLELLNKLKNKPQTDTKCVTEVKITNEHYKTASGHRDGMVVSTPAATEIADEIGKKYRKEIQEIRFPSTKKI